MVPKLKRALFPPLVLAALLLGLCRVSLAQGDADLEAPGLAPFPTTLARGATLFQNVLIFDGKSSTLSAPSDVLVKGNTIERISASPIPVDTDPNLRVIAANGRVLMPGLIDAHWHRVHGGDTPDAADDRRPLIPSSAGRATGRSNADAGFHNGARPWRSRVRAEARHRR